jgi:hypothetical protein
MSSLAPIPRRGAVLATALIFTGLALAFTQAPAQEETPPVDDGFPAGLAEALENLGQNILGGASFFAERQPPVDDGLPALELWLDDSARFPVIVNVFDDGHTWLRLTIADGAVLLEQDVTVRGQVDVDREGDLSDHIPPEPG